MTCLTDDKNRNSVWALGSLTRALQPVEGSDVIDAVQATVAPSPRYGIFIEISLKIATATFPNPV